MASISAMLSDGSEYVREGVVEKWKQWVILIILVIIQSVTMSIIPLFNGYLVRVYSAEFRSAPKVDEYKKLFIDGWKLNIIAILYMIPALIIAFILGVFSLAPIITGILSRGRIDEIIGIVLGSIGLMVAGLVFALITLIMYMAFVHFSRTGRLSDAFQIGAIIRKISDGIGWGQYVILWVIIWLFSMILFVIINGLNVIPPLGIIAGCVLGPLWGVFIARLTCNIYDNRP